MKKSIRALLCLALCLCLLLPMAAGAFAEAGWQQDSAGLYYLDADGSRHMGWLAYEGNRYYLDPYMRRDCLLEIDGSMYCFREDGTMAAGGWIDRSYDAYGETVHERLYAGADGALAMGWLQIDGAWYYFTPAMECGGMTSIDGAFYFFNEDGKLAADGWVRRSYGDPPDSWDLVFYALPSGRLVEGWRQIDGEWYYFTPAMTDNGSATFDGGETWYFFYDDGRMARGGWVHEVYTFYGVTTENWYYADDSGRLAKGWKAIDGWWYYFGPWMYSDCTEEIGGSSYTFDGQGHWTGGRPTVPGWNRIDGKWYYYDENLNRRTYWLQTGGKWYYLGGDGAMRTGWVKSGGSWYYMDGSGAMQTGWVKSGGKWYYLDDSGAMRTGWVKSGGKWYYMDDSGAMRTGWVKSGGSWYYLDDSGAMRTGWVKSGGSWYYLDESGAMRTGWVKSGGSWYYLDGSGAMLAGVTRSIGGRNYSFDTSGRCVNP